MKQIFSVAILLLMLSGVVGAQDETPAPTWPTQYYAPYVYPGTFPLAVTAENTGIRFYTLAFILAADSCQPAWGGAALLKNMTYLKPDIEKLRALGGDVMVSFGGAGGDELALVCPDVESLTEQYQMVIDAYGITHLDFDIEGDEIRDAESIERRSLAIAALQAAAAESGIPLSISFTLPVLPTGLTEDGIALLQSAIDNGVVIDGVNIMTMNFGENFPPDEMGDNTIQAAQSLFAQLRELYPDAEDADLWRMIGLTPMIGLNDRHPEVFTLEDAAAVTAFAQEQGIGRISMWSLGRDEECVSQQRIISDSCSGLVHDDLAFSAVFIPFTSAE